MAKLRAALVNDNTLSEEFTTLYNRTKHYEKHVVKDNRLNITEAEYEKAADALALTPVDNKVVHGYESMTKEGRTAYCKYDKGTELFVVYYYHKGSSVPRIITAYWKTWREFNGDKSIEYFDEIPQGK